MHLYLHLLLCFILYTSLAENRSTIITFPGNGIIGQKVKVSFVFFNIDFDLNFRISFSISDKILNLNFKNGENAIREIIIPSNNGETRWPYNCTITADNDQHGYHFNETRKISLQNSNEDIVKIVLHLDKPIYKPGDLLRIRVLIMDDKLKSLENANELTKMSIVNNKNEILKMVNNGGDTSKQLYLEHGILEYSYNIPSYASLGQWKINFEKIYHNITSKKIEYFDVQEYVLPTFEVIVNGSTVNNTIFKGTACGVYTFGGNVIGSASITNIGQKGLQLHKGCTSFTVDLEAHPVYTLDVVIFEHGTGISALTSYRLPRSWYIYYQDFFQGRIADENHSSKSTISQYQGNFYNFKPKLTKIVKYKIASPLKNNTVLLYLTYYKEKNVKEIVKQVQIDNLGNGVVKIRLPTISEQIKKIRGHLRFNHGEKRFDFTMTAWKDINGRFLSIEDIVAVSVKGDMCSPLIKMRLTYNTKHIEDDVDFHYQIIHSGSTIQMGKFKKSEYNSTSNKVNELESSVRVFLISLETPKLLLTKRYNIVVYYVYKGTIVSDYAVMENPKCKSNEIKLSSSTSEYKPGKRIKLKLKARPGSVCSVSVIDKSLELLAPHKSVNKYSDIENMKRNNQWPLSRDTYNSKDNRNCLYIAPPILEDLKQGPPGPAGPQSRSKRSYFPNHYSSSMDSLSSFLKSSQYLFTDLRVVSLNCHKYILMMAMSRNEKVELFGNPAPKLFMVEDSLMDATQLDGEEASGVDQTRHYFPENWLFELYPVQSSTKTIASRTPDTITTWHGYALCMNKQYGIGANEQPLEIVTKLNFFVKMNLPYSLKQKEKVIIPVTLHNFEKECINVRINMKMAKRLSAKNRSRLVCVCPEITSTVLFHVLARKSGKTTITVRAVSVKDKVCSQKTIHSKKIRDYVRKSIEVKPEGKPISFTESRFKCFKGASKDVLRLKFEHRPSEIAENSKKARISVVGDVLGPTLSGLRSLLRMPYGCGEQNMLSMVPSVYVLRYLTSANKLPDVQKLARQFVNIGYKREFQYQHNDSSFSAFGNRDESGSTWLTAFVLKSFSEAKEYIEDFDVKKMQEISNWLKGIQLENGCYPRFGNVLHKSMKGGLSDSDSTPTESNPLLTAYVVMALLKSGEDVESRPIKEAMNCLSNSIISDSYTLTLAAYNYRLMNQEEKYKKIMRKLKAFRIKKSGNMHWRSFKKSKRGSVSLKDEHVKEENKAVSIELTSYLMLSMLEGHDSQAMKIKSTLPIVKWLTSQRNDGGGFISTQDTIMALNALGQFAGLTAFPKSSSVEIDVNGMFKFNINDTNSMVLQRKKIKKMSNKFKFTINLKGEGCILYQAHLQYNVIIMEDSDKTRSFSLETQARFHDEDEKKAVISSCISYQGKDQVSNMVLVEVELQSGWETTEQHPSFAKLLSDSELNLKLFEVDKGKVNFYFEELTKARRCFEFHIFQKYEINNIKEASVFIYDYYNKDEFTRKGYQIKQLGKSEFLFNPEDAKTIQ